jgi:hypothetical protein
MEYRMYTEKKEDGTNKLTRKSRKTERRITFSYNKKLHSRRAKRARQQAKLEAQYAEEQESAEQTQ